MAEALRIEFDSARFRLAMIAAPRKLEREMDRAIGRSVLEMARTAKREAPKADSTLTNAIKSEQPNPLEGYVVAGVDYAELVAQKTGPQGVPPDRSILDWIKVKNITPNDPEMDEDDLAYVIARSISARGTPANPYHERAFDAHKQQAEARISAAIDRALEAA